jgi:hypothetical protein
MGRIFVCGDLHGSVRSSLKIFEFEAKDTFSKEDVLIQLGDFGWVWNHFGVDDLQEEMLDAFAKLPFSFAVIPGNHENYDVIFDLPMTEKWGAPVRVLEREGGEIYFLERGESYLINGKRILAIGGALSIDKHSRIPGVEYWEQELLTKKEENRALDNIEKYKKFDYILTHTCPERVLEQFIPPNFSHLGAVYCPVSKFLDIVQDEAEFGEWHFGHMHFDHEIEENGDYFRCHFLSPVYEL